MSSSRDRVEEIIRTYLPPAADWKIEKHTVRTVGTLSRTSIFIDYQTIGPLTETPDDLVDGFDLAIVSHRQDYSAAEDELDPLVRAFVRALDAATDVSWTGATKQAIGDYLAWVIQIQLITPKKG